MAMYCMLVTSILISGIATAVAQTPAPSQTQPQIQYQTKSSSSSSSSSEATKLPPGMLPYIAIHDPQFVSANEASFLQGDDVVLGVADKKMAKAYPAADLAQHGSVNDVMSSGAIEVTWCGVCNTGAVFRAQIDGKTLHFDYDSMVYANEVHKDRETGSRWQQSTGEAIDGPLKGRVLDMYPFTRTTWQEWRRRYPQTKVLKPLPGYDKNMANINKRMKALDPAGAGDAPKNAKPVDTRLHPRAVIAGLTVGSHAKAYPIAQLRLAKVVNDTVGGMPILVVHQTSSETTTAFEATVKNLAGKSQELTFQAADNDATLLSDQQTHSQWDAYGQCVKGKLKGARLRPLILMPEFWFAWSQFRPGTEVFLVKSVPESTSITQAPAWETLMQGPLPADGAPSLGAYLLTFLPATVTSSDKPNMGHRHAGPVFAYIVQGEIENEVEPAPLATYKPGDYFYEAPMHLHKSIRNLSQTDPAQVLIVQAGDRGKIRPGLKILADEKILQTSKQVIRLKRLTLPPDTSTTVATHANPTMLYVLEGTLSVANNDDAKTHASNELFVYPANGTALKLSNTHSVDKAKILLYEITAD